LLYWLIKTVLIPKLKPFFRFIVTCGFSLLFIGVVYLLVTVMPQGGTLVIDLFYKPWNILLFFVLLGFLSLILSHYPIYIDIWLYGDNDCVELRMKGKPRQDGKPRTAGIIYYDTKPTNDPGKVFNQEFPKSARRCLGILIFIAVFKIFIDLIPRFYEIPFDVVTVTIFALIIALYIYYRKGKMYDRWKKDIKSMDMDLRTKTVKDIIAYVNFFPKFFAFSCLLIIMTFLVSFILKWHLATMILLLCCLLIQAYLYIIFKICRTYFKYVYYSNDLYASNPAMFDKETLKAFKEYFGEDIKKSSSWILDRFAHLSDNGIYISWMRWFGFLVLALVLFINFVGFAEVFNPLIIILLYIIFFYSVGTIVFKHVLYHHRQKKGRLFFKYYVPLLVLIIVGLFTWSASRPNYLHQLSMVVQKQPLLDFAEAKNISTQGEDPWKKNYFFVGSYGGGLKANLWNLLLFNELEIETKNEFMDRTLVMSGVSGGAVGIGNYASLVYEQQGDTSKIKERIIKIGESNVLSTELTYLLGYDWLREYLPFTCFQGKDRNNESMKTHAKNTGMGDRYNTIAFSDYWRQIRDFRKGKFPALIMNPTRVGGSQGVATTVRFSDSTFAGADRITDFEGEYAGKTLTYFGAVSTTNRFPFFSPTAKIVTKGSYLDGGYFENSGLLSALEAYDALDEDKDGVVEDINPIFINIINSEDFYIAQKIREWNVKVKSLKETGEIGSILGTVASIDKLPRYVQEKIKSRGFVFEPIMMPHKISYGEVRAVIKGDIEDPIALMYNINAHNDTIDAVLQSYKKYDKQKWGVVEPPLARLLSEPAVYYQEAMVKNHPQVRNAIKRIKDYMNTSTRVNIKFQDSLKKAAPNLAGHRLISKYKNTKAE
tara:strand:+ start:18 stop:2660 length:2643 start_codon:yes stop_codon:yes gene_type:complete